MVWLVSKIPFYYSFRRWGFPKKLPLNLTLSLTYRCNSRCKTCNIYKKVSDELSLEEWQRIFASIKRNVFWATLSGGEPFLKNEIGEVVASFYDECLPSVINIPTNGILKDRIVNAVNGICTHCKRSRIIVNVSIDDIGEQNNAIRGVEGDYEKAIETFQALKSTNHPNLSVGLHTVISKYNVSRIPHIYSILRQYQPDSYITEIAEERAELGTLGSGITPALQDYMEAVDFLANELKKINARRMGILTRAFRIEYYSLVKKILSEQRQVIPCYAGFSSAQIAPDGDVWMCCIKAESAGNLREAGYDFKKVWLSPKAESLREKIKKGECFCPLANAAYTNMLQNPRVLLKVGMNLAGIGKR